MHVHHKKDNDHLRDIFGSVDEVSCVEIINKDLDMDYYNLIQQLNLYE
jgi:hypothetical protein